MPVPSDRTNVTGLVGWRAVAVAVAITGATSLLAGFVRYRLRRAALLASSPAAAGEEGEEGMPALEVVPAETAAVGARSWSPSEFCQTTIGFLESLGQRGTADRRTEQALRAALPQVMHFSDEARALAAHFLLAINAHYLTESANEQEFEQLMTKQVRTRDGQTQQQQRGAANETKGDTIAMPRPSRRRDDC
jgi:hypothetical protein